MDWCRLSTDYYRDPAVIRAGEEAELLFLRCIAYSGEQESGGRVPVAALPMLCPKRTEKRLDALLSNNLLLLDGEDVLIRSWDVHQERLDSESERRRKDRDRKRAARQAAKSADVSEDSSADTAQTVRPKSARIEEEVEEETSSTKKSVPRRTSTDDAFDTFWQTYPRRVGKQDALKAWKTALKTATAEQILEGAETYRLDPNRLDEFTKHPATWLRGGCWDDDPLPPRLHGGKPVSNGVASQPDEAYLDAGIFASRQGA